MSVNRWQVHRAGILNYWYYDEAEFLFAGGWDVPDRMSLISSYCTTLAYIMTGEQLASGHLWRWLKGLGDRQRC